MAIIMEKSLKSLEIARKEDDKREITALLHQYSDSEFASFLKQLLDDTEDEIRRLRRTNC